MNAVSRITLFVDALVAGCARLLVLQPRPAPVYVPVIVRRPVAIRIPVERR